MAYFRENGEFKRNSISFNNSRQCSVLKIEILITNGINSYKMWIFWESPSATIPYYKWLTKETIKHLHIFWNLNFEIRNLKLHIECLWINQTIEFDFEFEFECFKFQIMFILMSFSNVKIRNMNANGCEIVYNKTNFISFELEVLKYFDLFVMLFV